MKLFSRGLLLIAVLSLSACGQGMLNRNATATGPGVGAGGASDPTSVAFFNQNVGDRVLFSVDEHQLDAASRTLLDGQAQWLTANPEYSAVIEGHADEQGTQEYNFRLGERRANSVLQYLIQAGVAPNRLRTVSFGKERPLEICSEESCYRQNRRAVTVLSISGGV